MCFALIRTLGKKPIRNIDSENDSSLKDKYKKYQSKTHVSSKFLQVAAATMVFTAVVTNFAGQAQAKDYQAALSQQSSGIINTVKKSQVYTGLVVVVKTNSENPFFGSMSPRILSENGISIFGDVSDLTDAQADFVVTQGIAAFPKSIDEAKDRSGNNPLVVEALNVSGGDNIIVTDNDALKIALENKDTKFLEKFKVSFIIEEI